MWLSERKGERERDETCIESVDMLGGGGGGEGVGVGGEEEDLVVLKEEWGRGRGG